MWEQEVGVRWQDVELVPPSHQSRGEKTLFDESQMIAEKRTRLTCSWPLVCQVLAWQPHTWTSTINSTCGAYERSWGNGPCGKKGKEIKLRNRPWVSAEWEHCHSLFLCHFFRPWATRWPGAMSFVHSQVEMGNLRGLEKRYRKRSAFEDHPGCDNS